MQRHNSRLMSGVGIAALAVWTIGVTPPAALSQTETTPQAAPDNGIEEIVVTTRKREEKLQDVPVTVTAIGSQQIQQLGIQSLADVAALTPGLTYDEGISHIDTRPAIRGLYVQRGRPSVAILVDGFDVTSESIVSAGGGTLENQSLLDIERIEVVEGPQSALYGRSAFGGAVNYITRRPTQDFTAQLDADIGNYDSYKVFGTVSGPITDGLLFRVAAEGDGHENYYINNYNGQRLVGNADKGVSAELEATPTDALSLRFRAEATSQDEGQQAAADLHVNATQPNYCHTCSASPTLTVVKGFETASANQVNYTGNYPGTRSDTYRATFTADYDLGWATASSMTSILQDRTKLTLDTDYGAYAEPPAFFGYENEYQNLYDDTSQVSEELRISSPSDSKLKWLAGFLFFYEDDRVTDSTQYTQDHVNFFYPHAPLTLTNNNAIISPTTTDRRTYHESAYASVGYEVLPDFDIAGEIRIAEENLSVQKPYQSRTSIIEYIGGPGGITYGPGGVPLGITYVYGTLDTYYVNPKISLQYHITPDDMVYFSVSKGTKPGGYSLLNISNSSLVGDSFKPEKLYAYELGTKTDWLDHNLRFNADVYFDDYHDQQVSYADVNVSPPIAGVTNAGRVYGIGQEFELAYRPVNELTLNLSYNHIYEYYQSYVSNQSSDEEYLPGGNFKGKKLPSVPEHTLSFVGRYERPVTDAVNGFFQLTATYESARYGNSYNTWQFGSYIQPNFQLGVETDKRSALFYMNNVFNDATARSAISYLDLHHDFSSTALLYLPTPRTFGVRTSYKF